MISNGSLGEDGGLPPEHALAGALGESAHCFKRQAVYADFHAEIVEAITTRDGTWAKRAMHNHLQDVQENILRRAFSASALAEPVNA